MLFINKISHNLWILFLPQKVITLVKIDCTFFFLARSSLTLLMAIIINIVRIIS